MTIDLLRGLRDQPGARPSPKLRSAIGACFAADPVAALEAYRGESHQWLSPEGLPSPWPDPSVEKIWAPMAKKMKSLVKELSTRTLALLVREHATGWQLGYVLELGTKKDQQYRLDVWVGGAPNAAPSVGGDAAVGEWNVPDSLAAIYSVHDGFGRSGPEAFGVEALLPARGLESLPALIGTREDGSPMIEEHSLLAFFVDSVGHRRGFYRQGGKGGMLYKDAFDWDRNTKEASKAGTVEAVLGRELLNVLRGG